MELSESNGMLRPQRNFKMGIRDDPSNLRDPYQPKPNPYTGELQVDPDVVLIAQKFSLEIDFFYSTFVAGVASYGLGRSSSVNAWVDFSVANQTRITRGDF